MVRSQIHTPNQDMVRVLTPADEDYIRSLMEARPSIYLDEIQEGLLAEHEVRVFIPTVSRTLARMGRSKRSLSRKAAECNERLQALWELEITKLDDPGLFVFIDECR